WNLRLDHLLSKDFLGKSRPATGPRVPTRTVVRGRVGTALLRGVAVAGSPPRFSKTRIAIDRTRRPAGHLGARPATRPRAASAAGRGRRMKCLAPWPMCQTGRD